MTNIKWEKIAKPQPDAYDSLVVSNLLHAKYGWKKYQPTSTDVTICNRQVWVRPDRTISTTTVDENLSEAMDRVTPEYVETLTPYLTTWTDGCLWLGNFVDEFWPKWSKHMNPSARGCVSGHQQMHEAIRYAGEPKIVVYVSINDAQGCAEGIYHEAGHAKLEAIGIDIETHDGLLLANGPDELYDSPIRRDKKRPMSAVVQAIYSWMVFTENDIQCAKINAEHSSMYMMGNIPKIEDGLVEIERHVKFTPEGRKFLDGYLEWGHDVVRRAKVICQDVYKQEYDERYAKAQLYKQGY